MLNDIFKAFQGQVSERISNPLLGSFVVSWLIWNYKFVLILISKEPIERSFELIKTISFPDTKSLFAFGFIYPLLTALAYIFISPYPSKIVFSFTRKRQQEILEIKRKIDQETPLTIEESRSLRAELIKREEDLYKEIERRDKEIVRLKTDLESSLAVSADPPKKVKKPSFEITKSQMRLLQILDAHEGNMFHKALVGFSEEPKVKTEFDIGELDRANIISGAYNEDYRDYMYTFTHEGRRLFIERNGKQ